MRGDHLRRGHTTSCGCRVKETRFRKYPAEETEQRVMYGRYAAGAATRNYEFALTFNEFVLLASLNCYYCGAPPVARRQGVYRAVMNGIDRCDNNLGYIKTNVVPCCTVCNRAKGTLSAGEWETWLNRIVAFRSTK